MSIFVQTNLSIDNIICEEYMYKQNPQFQQIKYYYYSI